MKILFIGTGHMGAALVSGIKANNYFKGDIYVFNRTYQTSLNISKQHNVIAIENLKHLDYDIVVLGIRPDNMEELKTTLQKFEIKNQTFVTMINKISIKDMIDYLEKSNLNIVRIMPNMNATIGKSVTAYASNNLKPTRTKFVVNMLQKCGTVEEIPEEKFSTFTALAGCSPSYIFTFLNSFYNYAINNGFPKAQAYRIIKDTFTGSVEYSMNSNNSLEELIESICVPNGSTIEGQRILESNKFQDIVIKTLEAAKQKS